MGLAEEFAEIEAEQRAIDEARRAVAHFAPDVQRKLLLRAAAQIEVEGHLHGGRGLRGHITALEVLRQMTGGAVAEQARPEADEAPHMAPADSPASWRGLLKVLDAIGEPVRVPGIAHTLYGVIVDPSRRNAQERRIRSYLSNLKARGFVDNDGEGLWFITSAGKGAIATK